MAESIGEKLRLARETQGIALREISEQTRISMRYLEAIETDDYRRLPGGIFNRSFIRAYAKFVGYDEHEALEDYARTMRERGESDDDATKPFRSLVYTDSHSRSPLVTLLLAVVILAALSAAVWAGLHFYQRSMGQRSRPPGTGQHNIPGRSSSENHLHHSTMIREPARNQKLVKEGQHDFTV